MPIQTNIQQTILNGEYSLSTLVNNNLNLVNKGNLPIKVDFINFYNASLQALIYRYNSGDYISSVTTTLFDRINNFVGIPFGANIQSGFINPSITLSVVTSFTPTPPYNKTQANLLYDSTVGQWYLPFLDNNGNLPPSNTVPVLVTTTISNTSFDFQLKDDVSPMRIYGFGSNATQNIVVYVTP